MKILNKYGTPVDEGGYTLVTIVSRNEWHRVWEIMEEREIREKSDYLRRLVRGDIARYELEQLLNPVARGGELIVPLPVEWIEKLQGLLKELPEEHRKKLKLKGL